MDESDFVRQLLDPRTREVAFNDLVRQYQRPLYSLIRKIVLNHDDADDVLQNTFIKVFSNLPKFKGESKLFSWMYRIATNEALSHLKQKAKKSGFTTAAYQESAIANLHADPYFDGNQAAIKLQKAILTLPEKQQLVFKMKYFEEMKYEEISEIVGTSVGALKASYHHAVKKVEDYLAKH